MIKRVEDYRHLFDLIHLSHRNEVELLNLKQADCPGHSGFMTYDKYVSSAKGFTFYAIDNIACVGIEKKSEKRYKIHFLSVHPEHQNKGVGKHFMLEIMEMIHREGGRLITLGMICENQKLLTWYEKLGFEVKKIKKYKQVHLAFMEYKYENIQTEIK